MSLTSPAVLSTSHLLHPWNEDDASAPQAIVFTAKPENVSMAVETGEEDTVRPEVALEITDGKVRALIYHPHSDAPIVLHWEEDGFTICAHDADQEGLRVSIDRSR